MDKADYAVFVALFRGAFEKCFGRPITTALSEPESRRMSDVILEQTGLVIGWKSIKNYSIFILDRARRREENPSLATLDTFARYLLDAPKIDERQRQDQERQSSYWFQYRKSHPTDAGRQRASWVTVITVVLVAFVVVVALFGPRLFHSTSPAAFRDDFRSVQDDSLAARGWTVLHRDAAAWSKRGERSGTITLYTLQGDNWPDSIRAPEVKNLLVRPLDDRCFTVEVRLVDFVPRRNWEQAGILLMEDTVFTKPCVRLSIAYNDYTGGFPGPREILVQAITCAGSISEKPEEVVHRTIFTLDAGTEGLVESNLKYSALRIEKDGEELRFLYSASAMENAAFKEVGQHTLGFSPRYVGLFALKGFVADSAVVPARFSYFSITPIACGN